MKDAADWLMGELEVNKSSKRLDKQSVKDRKDVIWNGYVQDKFGKLCLDERERAKVIE